jgi:hypothetical protein
MKTTYSGITGGSVYVGIGGTGGDGDTAGAGSIEPGGRVKFSLFFDIVAARQSFQ